ncbi:MAG TPA: 7TM diverse intracellular signaling domain-containing protein [Puia sp.]|nr:7TM diverse intracellular signaling domain-containing protein [Puia sp.]
MRTFLVIIAPLLLLTSGLHSQSPAAAHSGTLPSSTTARSGPPSPFDSVWLRLPGPSPDSSLVKYGFHDQLLTTAPGFFIDSGRHRLIDSPGRMIIQPFHATWSGVTRLIEKDPASYDFWIRFWLKNDSDSSLDVSIFCGNINYTDVWFSSPGHAPVHLSGGSLRSPLPGTTLVQQRYNILPLRLAPHQFGEIFLCLRQKTNDFSFSAIQLFTPNALNAGFAIDYEQDHADKAFQWLFQGFMLCQLLYVLFQWLIIRRKEYGYYFCYIAALILYFLSKEETDLGLPLLFTRMPLLKVYLGRTLLILPYFLYFRFIRSFLEIPACYPALNKWIVPLEYFLLGYMIFDFVFILVTFDQQRQNTFFTIVLLAVFLLSTSFIVYLFRYRQTLINYVLTGSLIVAVGNILGQVFTYLQNYKGQNIGIYDILIFPQAGVLLEMICFTAGLGYKRHMAEKEKIRSQEELIEQLQANEQLQQRMQYIRNKIAQDLHDDIGSTLSSISILSDLALRGDNSGQARETMSEIKDSSLMLMERMDDIVWSINPRNDSLENLLMRVRHFATTLFEAREIEYTIDIQKKLDEIKLPMDHRQHIYLVLKEAINNLVKYSHATQAVLRVGFDQHTLELLVKDNGKGFDRQSPSTGNGISGMQRRAGLMGAQLAITSAPGQGTEIRLTVQAFV